MARHKLAVIALAAIALCSIFWALLDVLGAVSHNQIFGVTSYEIRFDDFRKTVQPHSVYGYASDNAPNDPAARPEYFLTQYTLAPALVHATADEPLVVLNYHDQKQVEKVLLADKLAVVQNFGNGVVLCRRAK